MRGIISIKFANMAQERMGSVIRYEMNVITMTLIRFSYLVHGLGNRIMTLSTKTDL